MKQHCACPKFQCWKTKLLQWQQIVMKCTDQMCVSYAPIDVNGSSLLPLVAAVGAQTIDNYYVYIKEKKNYPDSNLVWDKLIRKELPTRTGLFKRNTVMETVRDLHF